MLNKPRQRKCRSCKELFQPWVTTAVACSVPCAIAITRVAAAKVVSKDLKQRRQAAKTLGQLHKEAQPFFNKYIRLRDQGQPCISCQRHHQGQYHAGHYRSVGGSPELRYNESNCHLQCSVCNNHLSGNAIDYRINLINKIGIKAVELLEGPNDPAKYTREDIQGIKAKYRLMTKQLEDQPQLNHGE